MAGDYKRVATEAEIMRQVCFIRVAIHASRTCSEMRRRSTHKWIPPKLPRCDGPKLGQFLHHNSRIQWLERLDTDADRQLSTQGFIFRAVIEGKEYAIKVVSEKDEAAFVAI